MIFTKKKLLDIHRYMKKFISHNTSEKEFSVAPLNNSFSKMKLYEIEIQPFDGEFDLWSEFCDNFQYQYGQDILHAKQKFKQLKILKLADINSNNENLCIDILIGSDFLWDIFESGII